MSRRRPLSIQALRALLLLAFVGLVALVVSLLGSRRGDRLTPAEIADQIAAEDGADGGFAVWGEEFRHAVWHDDRRVFEIEGASHRADPEGRAFLQGVTVRMERQEGSYLITGDQASYDPATSEARIEGNVEVRGPRDLRLWCEWLDLGEEGRRLVASRGARFAIEGRARGTAEQLRADLQRGHVQLSGGVEIETAPGIEPPGFLRAARVWLSEEEHVMRAQGEVVVGRGDDRLYARRLTLFLDDSNRNVERIRALWEVRGLLHSAAFQRRQVNAAPAAADKLEEPAETSADEVMRLAGQRLAIGLDPATGDPTWVQLTGMRSTPATVVTELAGVREREIAAVEIHGGFNRGVIATVRAEGNVRVEERSLAEDGAAVRRLSASRAEVDFDDLGQMITVHLEEDVELDDGEMRAVGHSADLHFVTHRFDLLGKPLCEVFTGQGRITAPEISYNEASGLLHAVNGVRTVLDAESAGALGATPLGATGGPISVESREALMRSGSDEFLFREAVRAWQGSNVLVADQLRGDRQDGKRRLAGSGGVKTIWHRPPGETASDSRGAEENGAGDQRSLSAQEPIEIEAEHLTYVEGQAEGGLRYHGEVSVLQAGRLMTCSELQLDLDDRSQAEVMHCLGGSRLTDPATGRDIRGERTIYWVARQEIEVFGSPMILESPQLGRIEGFHLRYGLEDGILHLDEPPSPDTP